MQRFLVIAAFCGLVSIPALARADAPSAPVGIAIVDFDYADTSGEIRDQKQDHQKRLQAFMEKLKGDLQSTGKYRPVALACGSAACSSSTPPSHLRDAAQTAGAEIVLIGGIHKTSTLVEWAKVQAFAVATDKILFDQLYTFRGDNDEAWQRAEAFMSRDIAAMSPPAAAPADAPPRTKIAVFNFELEDFSAGHAAEAGDKKADAAYVKDVTDTVRHLLAQSNRYSLVDVAPADAEVAKTHGLRSCNGCEAGIALHLGAEQSLIGLVTRISRTEYTIRFEIRDAHTGAIVASKSSDLRIGADYSWSRGAASLVRNKLLDDTSR